MCCSVVGRFFFLSSFFLSYQLTTARSTKLVAAQTRWQKRNTSEREKLHLILKLEHFDLHENNTDPSQQKKISTIYFVYFLRNELQFYKKKKVKNKNIRQISKITTMNSTTMRQQHQLQWKLKQPVRIVQLKRPQQQKFKQCQQQQQHQWLAVSVVMLTLFTVTIEGITEELSPGKWDINFCLFSALVWRQLSTCKPMKEILLNKIVNRFFVCLLAGLLSLPFLRFFNLKCNNCWVSKRLRFFHLFLFSIRKQLLNLVAVFHLLKNKRLTVCLILKITVLICMTKRSVLFFVMCFDA